jgi:hypothetical protein
MPIDDKMSVDERCKYLKLVAPRYAKAGRVERSALLTEMAAVTGLHRKSLLRLLHGPTLERAPKNGGGSVGGGMVPRWPEWYGWCGRAWTTCVRSA